MADLIIGVPSVGAVETVKSTAQAIEIDTPLRSTESFSGSFNINSFRSEIKKNDILPIHSYLVVFSPFISEFTGKNNHLTKFVMNNPGTLVMRCSSAILPGVSLMTENIRRYTYGPNETMPNGVQFTNLTLEWIVDRSAKVVQFFDSWMNFIVNFDSKGGGDMNFEAATTYLPYEIGYKDEYSNRQMNIFVYDRQQQKTIVYTIYDVFPVQINDMNVDWGQQDQAMKLTVQFAFTDYKISTPKLAPLQPNFAVDTRSASEQLQDPFNLRGSSQVSFLTPPNNSAVDVLLYKSAADNVPGLQGQGSGPPSFSSPIPAPTTFKYPNP